MGKGDGIINLQILSVSNGNERKGEDMAAVNRLFFGSKRNTPAPALSFSIIWRPLFILVISFAAAALYIVLGGMIMDYGCDVSRSLLFRFLPVFLIQFGMSCLGVMIVLLRNKEKLSEHGLVRKNLLQSLIGSLAVSAPAMVFLFATQT